MINSKQIIMSIVMGIVAIIYMIFIIKPNFLYKDALVETISDYNQYTTLQYKIDGNKLTTIGKDPQIYLTVNGKYNKVVINFDKNHLPKKDFAVQLFYTKNSNYTAKNSIMKRVIPPVSSVIFESNEDSGYLGNKNARIDLGSAKKLSFVVNSIQFFDRKPVVTLFGVILLVCVFFFGFVLLNIWLYLVKRLKLDKRQKYLIYIIAFVLLYFSSCILTRGRLIPYAFLNDATNSYMDFFNSVDNARYGNPYDKLSNYPALALLFYKVLFHIIPKYLYGKDGFDLRNNQMIQLLFLLTNMLGVFGIISIILANAKATVKNRFLLGTMILISLPMLFALERGNIILFAVLFTMIFAFYYKSKNKAIRELAYVSLAIAAGIKIYPAIFGLLLVKERKWKDAVRLGMYGIFTFFLPFSFYGGMHGLKRMIKALLYTTGITSKKGFGLNVSLFNILEMFNHYFGLNLSDNILMGIVCVFFVLMIVGFFIQKDRFLEYLYLSLILILIPKTSYYYACLFLFIPFAMFFAVDENFSDKVNKKIILFKSMFFILFVPWPMGKIRAISDGGPYITSAGMLLQYLILLISIGGVIYITFIENKNILKIGNGKNEKN